MSIKHQFQSGRGDNGDPGAVNPSNWNADHVLDGMLAALDAVAPAPSVVFTFDGSANLQLLPYSSFAPTNSPAFTGVPTAPTAASNSNGTQIATTAFVTTAITNLIGGAPGALNTLNELATAINDDASYAATVTAALGVRLRVDTAQGLSSGQQAQAIANLGLTIGTAAALNVGVAANNVVQLNGSAKLPAVDGSLLTNVVAALPVGMCAHFPANVLPTGWLARNGALVSRTTYAALWAYAQASGNIAASDGAWTEGQFSPGDGSTTFRLPDDRGDFIRGWDNGRGIDSGRTIGSYQADAMQGHQHQWTAGNGRTYSPDINNGAPTPTGATSYGYVTPTIGLPISDGTNGTPRTAAETRPRNVAWIGCIKY